MSQVIRTRKAYYDLGPTMEFLKSYQEIATKCPDFRGREIPHILDYGDEKVSMASIRQMALEAKQLLEMGKANGGFTDHTEWILETLSKMGTERKKAVKK